MKKIELANGRGFALVDDADFERVNQYSWYLLLKRGKPTNYVIGRLPGGNPPIRLHRFIMNAPKGVQVDHINGNGLDNRRENLRFCTGSQNNANSRKRRGCSSKFKGVILDKKSGRWDARIKLHGKEYHLGSFINEKNAARAYNKAALEMFGQFARINDLD